MFAGAIKLRYQKNKPAPINASGSSRKKCGAAAGGGGGRGPLRQSSLTNLLPLPIPSMGGSGGSAGSMGDVSGISPTTITTATTAAGGSPATSSSCLMLPATTGGPNTPNNTNSSLLNVEVLMAASRQRSGSAPTIKYTLAACWNLKADHVRALKVTWARLCSLPSSNCQGILSIMERVFEKLEVKEKTLRDVFYRSAFMDSMDDIRIRRRRSDTSIATLHDHTHFFVSLLSQVIQSLEKGPDEQFEHIDKIGCFHSQLVRYGFKMQMWDKLGLCLIDALVVQDCLRGFPDACRAWTLLVAGLIDRLRSAPRRSFQYTDPSIDLKNNPNASAHFRNRVPSLTLSACSNSNGNRGGPRFSLGGGADTEVETKLSLLQLQHHHKEGRTCKQRSQSQQRFMG